MARKEYLTQEERNRSDNPPQLLTDQKGLFLQIPEWTSTYLKTLQTSTTQVGFLLQLGSGESQNYNLIPLAVV